MRSFSWVAVWLAFAALTLACAGPVAAESEENWQLCAGSATAPDLRVTACAAIIDGKTETSERLANAYCNRGHGLTEQRHFHDAIADLNEAIRIAPSHACAYNNRGRAYAFKRDFDRAIKLDPTLAIAYGNRAYIFYQMRDTTHAIADYTMQIKLKPDVLAYINRGNAYRDSEQLDRAAADYGEVIRIAPEDARGWRNRGLIRLFQGDNKSGIADYDKALQYDSTDADSWNNRGQAKIRLGDKPGAIADLKKALELYPDLPTAREALQKLGVKL